MPPRSTVLLPVYIISCYFVYLCAHLLVQVVAAGSNPVQITRGIEKTAKALVEELRNLSKEVKLIALLFGLHEYLIWAIVLQSSWIICICIMCYQFCIFYLHGHFLLQVEDSELADVAAVSAGNNYEVGNMIAEAMSKVGRKGVVTLEEGRSSENNLYVVEGMQFDRGYISPYFVTDSEKMTAEFENCKVA
jgi:chaperonin GroEL